MKQGTLLLLLFLSGGLRSYAGIFPEDHMHLNYIEFQMHCEAEKEAGQYTFVIEKTDSLFHPMGSEPQMFMSQSNSVWVSDLEFGSCYRWYVLAGKKKKKKKKIQYHYFSTQSSRWVDPSKYRARMIKNLDSSTHQWIVSDYARVAYNAKGQAVWFLPDIDGILKEEDMVRDLRFTKDRTVTFLFDDYGVECTKEGKLLWVTPKEGKISGDTSEHYHHSFEKLPDGTYLTMGQRYVYKKIPKEQDMDYYKNQADCKIEGDNIFKIVIFGTVLQYDADKNLIWHWSSEDYLKMEDLLANRDPSGRITPNAHLNAVNMDLDKGLVSVGFRDINRIMIMDKKSKKILNSLGDKKPSGEAFSGNGFFRTQHDCGILPNGKILIFNNNTNKRKGGLPQSSTVLILDIGNDFKQQAKVDFEFDCHFDSLSDGNSQRFGNVQMLNEDTMLVCMGQLNRIVVLDKAKKIITDLFIEQYDAESKTWKAFSQYRAYRFNIKQ